MRLLPFPFYSVLSPTDLRIHECSDRIVVPKALYDDYSKPGALLHISNGVGESVGGVLHGAHDGDDQLVFVPSWMFYHFKTHDDVVLTTIPSVPCEHIQLRPPTVGALVKDGTMDAFQAALQSYKTLTQNTRILVGTDPPMTVGIELLHPATPHTLLVHQVGTVSLTILSAKTETPFLYKSPVRNIPFVGRSHTLGEGTASEDADTCRARMVSAASRRIHGHGHGGAC